ncbi:MAG: glycosyltransferase family 4 protein [Lachnospiraceae bacterium]|nr:glycosyltransferase family 4 protein [Lachnospiraceae bacterium]
MMRVFVVGDYRTGTGPANVTKEYLLRFPENTARLIFKSKPLRALEIILKMPFCSVVLISGYSRQNLLTLKWARALGKPCAYLMHGCVEHENAINECVDETMNLVERKTMELSDAIYAVSNHFAGWLKTNYPEYSDRISAAVNGVDTRLLDNMDGFTGFGRDKNMVFTIGGGMPRKKIKHICAAIDLINRKTGEPQLKLVVIGDKGRDDDIINSYPFVENMGLVGSNITKGLYREASLFVQNSCFETFGLAPMEALVNGCSVLMSRETGAIELFGGLEDGDIIDNWYDDAEIALKIEALLKKGNAARLAASFDKESSSWEERTIGLWKKLQELQTEKRTAAGK